MHRTKSRYKPPRRFRGPRLPADPLKLTLAQAASRRCKSCNRWISMRRMPHGGWVPFEHNEVHDCAKPKVEKLKPPPPKPSIAAPIEFPDIVVPDDVPAKANSEPILRRINYDELSTLSGSKARPPDTIGPSPTPTDGQPISVQGKSNPAPARKPNSASPNIAETPRVTATMSKGVLSAALSAILTVYIIIGALHSIAFSLFVSRATCATTTQSLVYIFCHTGTGISHLVTVLGWPWYWF
jgi:hypothetical protein